MSAKGFSEWLAEKDPELLQREFDLMGLLFDKKARDGYKDAVADRWNYGNWPILKSFPPSLLAGLGGTLATSMIPGVGPLAAPAVGTAAMLANMWTRARAAQQDQWDKEHPSGSSSAIDDIFGKEEEPKTTVILKKAAMKKRMKGA
jgi:hypothetical protein